MKYIILIPAYEPDYHLLDLVKAIDNKYDTIVVNDGSGKLYDNIFDIVKDYAHLITFKDNKGKGYALKEGLRYIKDTYKDKDYVVVTMDADLQHTIRDAIKLCDYAKEHKDTLVLGKREWNRNMPIRSMIGNYITRKIYKKVTGMTIYDTQTGLRAFSNELIDYMLSNKGNRYEYEMNVLLNLSKNNINYYEISIETIYINHNKGSHYNTVKDSYKILLEILKWKKYCKIDKFKD